MAFMDDLERFSVLQSVVGAVGDFDSTNVLNFGRADPNIGAGTPQWLWCTVGTTVTSAGAATLKATVRHSDDGITYTDLYAGPAHAKSVCVTDFKILAQPLPYEHKQFLKIVFTRGVAALTAGTVNAWIGGAP